MSNRVIAFSLIQGAILVYSLSLSSGRASEPGTNLPVPLITNLPGQRVVGDVIEISNRFAGFVPGSLANTVWTGFHTNGRSLRMWEFWQLPPGWPSKPPVLRWNTNNLMWGRKGMTAISQVVEGMGSFGQGAHYRPDAAAWLCARPRHGPQRVASERGWAAGFGFAPSTTS